MYRIVAVNPKKGEIQEPLGTKRKFWFNDDEGRRILFKAEERGTGEDWAEKIACELAGLLGLPHVHYDLAEETNGRTPGVVCETFTPSPLSLVLGNQVLFDRDPNYPAGKYRVREHTTDVVAQVVSVWALPPPAFTGNLPTGTSMALDVFIGYVMLDAWIANQDRHHENWAAIRDGNVHRLAPTYDHGASLARNLTETERKERLTTRDVNRQLPAFVRKARSAFYRKPTDDKPLLAFDAWQEFARRSQPASSAWLDRLRGISDEDVHHVLMNIPPWRMSPLCRKFTQQLLHENKQRLLQEGLNE
jgi:hypothetical protein